MSGGKTKGLVTFTAEEIDRIRHGLRVPDFGESIEHEIRRRVESEIRERIEHEMMEGRYGALRVSERMAYDREMVTRESERRAVVIASMSALKIPAPTKVTRRAVYPEDHFTDRDEASPRTWAKIGMVVVFSKAESFDIATKHTTVPVIGGCPYRIKRVAEVTGAGGFGTSGFVQLQAFDPCWIPMAYMQHDPDHAFASGDEVVWSKAPAGGVHTVHIVGRGDSSGKATDPAAYVSTTGAVMRANDMTLYRSCAKLSEQEILDDLEYWDRVCGARKA